jgi:hypothetical protein
MLFSFAKDSTVIGISNDIDVCPCRGESAARYEKCGFDGSQLPAFHLTGLFRGNASM